MRRMLKDGPKSWRQFRDELGISPATLGKYSRELVKKGEVRTYNDLKDRRITWYEAIKEKMESEIIRNESLAFIDSLEEPLTVLEKSKDGKTAVSIFMTPVQQEHPARKVFEEAVRSHAKDWVRYSEKTLKIPREGYKMAVVLTKEK